MADWIPSYTLFETRSRDAMTIIPSTITANPPAPWHFTVFVFIAIVYAPRPTLTTAAKPRITVNIRAAPNISGVTAESWNAFPVFVVMFPWIAVALVDSVPVILDWILSYTMLPTSSKTETTMIPITPPTSARFCAFVFIVTTSKRPNKTNNTIKDYISARLHYIRMADKETLTENIQIRMKPKLINALDSYAIKNGFKDRSELVRYFCHMGLQQSPTIVKTLFRGD